MSILVEMFFKALEGSREYKSRNRSSLMDLRKAMSIGALPLIALVALNLASYPFIDAGRWTAILFFVLETVVRSYAGYLAASKGEGYPGAVLIAAATSGLAVLANDLMGSILMIAGFGPFASTFAAIPASGMAGFMTEFIIGAVFVALCMSVAGAICGFLGALVWKFQNPEN
jgi:hypothetical protein